MIPQCNDCANYKDYTMAVKFISIISFTFFFVCHETVGLISNHHLFLFHCGIPDWLAQDWNMHRTLYLLPILVNVNTYREKSVTTDLFRFI
jgi:hypothetical protein